MLDVFDHIRTLAKSNKYQSLYNHAKELKIQIFQNTCDFSALQLQFLNDLAFYAGLMTDYAMGEVDFIVFENTIYEDAYHYYKVNTNRKKLKNHNQDISDKPTRPARSGEKESLDIGSSSWVFKSPKKGRI